MKIVSALRLVAALASVSMAAGCASSYSWRPNVPEKFRTVSVPEFRNESQLNELGATMTRQMLREFQREGTFKIKRAGDAALEIQGTVKQVSSSSGGYNRRIGMRYNAYEMKVMAEVSVIDKINGLVLVDNRMFTAETEFTAGQDLSTSERDAAGRVADHLARQVVDMVRSLKFEDGESRKEQKHE